MYHQKNPERTSSNTIGGIDGGWSGTSRRKSLQTTNSGGGTRTSNSLGRKNEQRQRHSLPEKPRHTESAFDTSAWSDEVPSGSNPHGRTFDNSVGLGAASGNDDCWNDDQWGSGSGDQWGSSDGWGSPTGNGWNTDANFVTTTPAPASNGGWASNIKNPSMNDTYRDPSGSNVTSSHEDLVHLTSAPEVQVHAVVVDVAGERRPTIGDAGKRMIKAALSMPNRVSSRDANPRIPKAQVPPPPSSNDPVSTTFEDRAPLSTGHSEMTKNFLPSCSEDVTENNQTEAEAGTGTTLDASERVNTFKQIITLMAKASIIKTDLLKYQSKCQAWTSQLHAGPGALQSTLTQKPEFIATQKKTKELESRYNQTLKELMGLPNITIIDQPGPLVDAPVIDTSLIQDYIDEVQAYQSEIHSIYMQYQAELLLSSDRNNELANHLDTTELISDQQSGHNANDPSLKIFADWNELNTRAARLGHSLSCVKVQGTWKGQVEDDMQLEFEAQCEDFINWEGSEDNSQLPVLPNVIHIEMFQDFKAKVENRRNAIVVLQEVNNHKKEMITKMANHLGQLNTWEEERAKLISYLRSHVNLTQDMERSAFYLVNLILKKELSPALEGLNAEIHATMSRKHGNASHLINQKLEEVLSLTKEVKIVANKWGEQFQALAEAAAQNDLLS